MKPISVIAISGSLRKDSYNTHLVKATQKLAPSHVSIETITLESIPMFIEDHEIPVPPQPVQLLKEKLLACDGVLIATPEYNRSLPGVLKNTLDWISGGNHGTSALSGKPLAIMGATNGRFGTLSAQNQMLFLGAHMNMKVWGKLRLYISEAESLFNQAGDLIDEQTQKRLTAFLNDFYDFVVGH